MWGATRKSKRRPAHRPPLYRSACDDSGNGRVRHHWRRLAVLARSLSVIRRSRHVDIRAVIAGLAARPAPAAVIVAMLIDWRLLVPARCMIAVGRAAVIAVDRL